MKKAFTLLELLVGITIFVIVCGAIYSSLYLGIRVYKQEQNSNALSSEMMLTFNVLGSDLYSIFMNPDNEELTFKGSSERVEFFNLDKQGFIYQTGFYLESSGDPDRFELMLHRKKLLPEPDDKDPEIELINNKVHSLKFSYFNSDQNQWYDDWPEELSVPNQIKIEIEFIDQANSENIIKMEKYVSIPIANPIPLENIE